MKILRYCLSLLTATALAVVLNAIPAQAAGDEQQMKVGKNGDIMFNSEMRIGDATLGPGHYRFQHRTEGSDHFVQFTLLKGMHNPNHPGSPSGYAEAGQIKCRIESLDEKIDQTAVYHSRGEDGTQRVTRILVRGENVAHLF